MKEIWVAASWRLKRALSPARLESSLKSACSWSVGRSVLGRITAWVAFRAIKLWRNFVTTDLQSLREWSCRYKLWKKNINHLKKNLTACWAKSIRILWWTGTWRGDALCGSKRATTSKRRYALRRLQRSEAFSLDFKDFASRCTIWAFDKPSIASAWLSRKMIFNGKWVASWLFKKAS